MPVTSDTAMVVTAHPGASIAGRDMLRAGGTACDAAVAAAFALTVLEPPCSGLGGGGMALVREHAGADIRGLDFREVAPAAATADMFWRDGAIDWDLATESAQAVAVPGAVAGLAALHASCGVLPWAQVLEPARIAAGAGFEVDLRYHRIAAFRAASLRGDPEATRLFFAPRCRRDLGRAPARQRHRSSGFGPHLGQHWRRSWRGLLPWKHRGPAQWLRASSGRSDKPRRLGRLQAALAHPLGGQLSRPSYRHRPPCPRVAECTCLRC